MKITSLRVEPHDFDKPITGDAVSNNAEDYVSERVKPNVVDLIDDEGTYFYRSDDTTIEITADEYANIFVNPRFKETGVPQMRVSEIIAGKRAITVDTGLRLSRYFGLNDSFWTGLQLDHDAARAKDELAEVLANIKPIEFT
jgi:addiction module HigA family antidote